jgi:tRNA (guanine-N7-)-methyltransferase
VNNAEDVRQNIYNKTMIRSYVFRGRTSRAQALAYNNLSTRYCIPFSEQSISFESVFQNNNPVICEIGFGMGTATVEIARANPDKNYLGIEVFKAGIGRLLWEIEKSDIKNIRIIEGDAVRALTLMVAANSVEAFYIFFPDPWPKKKHHKRRLIRRPFTGLLAQKLIPGGLVYMVTDWPDYADFALGELNETSGLKNVYAAFAPPQPWRPKTKFELKGLAKDHIIKELIFRNV